MMKKFALVAGAVSLLWASSAFAAGSVALVGEVQGKVMVNSGEGYVPVASAAELAPGATVFVGPKSSAKLTYTEANCSVNLAAGSVVTIKKNAPCAEVASPVADAPMPEVAFSPLPLLVGGLAVAGLVGLIIATSDDEEPVSP